MSRQLSLPCTGLLVECVRVGRRLRVRPLSDGLERWNVAFPLALRVEGARYSVERLRPMSRRYYRATGQISRLVEPAKGPQARDDWGGP